jgi:hypothetical protein
MTITPALTLSIVEKLIKAIWGLLEKGKPSEKDLKELKEKLTQLINRSNNTGIALERYVSLLKYSTEASVHSTELQSVLEAMPKDIAKQQFTKLRGVRMETNLRKEGLEPIRRFREDYEKVREYYDNGVQHLHRAEEQFKDADSITCVQEMRYLNQELDKIVMHVKRRIDEQTEALREGYKVLERIK